MSKIGDAVFIDRYCTAEGAEIFSDVFGVVTGFENDGIFVAALWDHTEGDLLTGEEGIAYLSISCGDNWRVLEKDAPLPDDVVRRLAKWRMRGG